MSSVTSTAARAGVAAGSADTAEWHPRIVAFLCNWCSYAGLTSPA